MAVMYDSGNVMVVAIAPGGRLLVNAFSDAHAQSMSMKLSRWRSNRDFPFLPVGILRCSPDTVSTFVGQTPYAGFLADNMVWARFLFVEPRYMADWSRHLQTLADSDLRRLFTEWTAGFSVVSGERGPLSGVEARAGV